MTSERERFAVMHQFGRTYRAFMAAFESYVGQPMPRWRIMLALHDHTGGGLAQKQLAERLQMDPGALTRQLKVLEQLGWIERTTDARDNRLTNVSLSDAGLSVVLECMPRRVAFLHATLDGLPDDQVQALSEALAVIETRIAEAPVQLGTPVAEPTETR
ncbi:MarR family winged helix-turn-helix transcriptional regulator [Ralstonia nicotianae]|nr:MarR family transcriptional regulator [Ralstonia solanacearum]